MIDTLRGKQESLFIVIGDISQLGVPMIGEDENAPADIRGSETKRAAWMAKELLIASVRLAASRKMPVWMPKTSKYCSLAALVLSEYVHADVAETVVPVKDRGQDRCPPLNFFHSRSGDTAPRSDPAWQQAFRTNRVIEPSQRVFSLQAALETTGAKRIVCIGAGSKVSGAYRLAEKRGIAITTLDFSKKSVGRTRKNNTESSAWLQERLLRARGELRPYRAKTKQDERDNTQTKGLKIPVLLHLFPPVPLLVYWKLEEMLPSR